MWASCERWWAENIIEKAKKQATSQIWAQFLAVLLTQCSTWFENFKLQFLMRDSKTSPTECSSSFLSHMDPVCLNVTFCSWPVSVLVATRPYQDLSSNNLSISSSQAKAASCCITISSGEGTKSPLTCPKPGRSFISSVIRKFGGS